MTKQYNLILLPCIPHKSFFHSGQEKCKYLKKKAMFSFDLDRILSDIISLVLIISFQLLYRSLVQFLTS